MSQPEKRRFHRFLLLLFLTAVLILAAAFVLLLPVRKEQVPAYGSAKNTAEPTYQLIAQQNPQSLESITVSHASGETYTLVYQNNTLLLLSKTGESEPINKSFSENFIKYATEIYIEDTVTQDQNELTENLSDMGLQPPQILVLVMYTNGNTDTISLGYNLPNTPYHYYQWSGNHGIYLCNPGIYQTFEYTADMLLTITQPSIIPLLVERVSILPKESEPIVCTFVADSENTVTGTLQSPFAYPMDSAATETLLSAVENFRLGARLQAITDENLALYGFDAPQAVVKIAQREGLYSLTDSDGVLQTYPIAASNITLTIGDKDGEFFYYCEVNGICYRVSSFLAASFLSADAMNYLTNNPADLGDENIQSITIQTGSGTLNIRATYTEQVLPNNELETDKYGNIVYTVDVTLDGSPITVEAFIALIARLQQMAISGRLKTPSESDGALRWQIILTTVLGKSRTLSAYPMDSFHDILAVDGVALHYINNEALEIALGEFAALIGQTDTP